MDTDFSRRLAAALEATGMRKADIARALGVARTSVSAWFTGRARPSAANVARLAELLGVSHDWLLSGANPAGDRLRAAVADLDESALERFYSSESVDRAAFDEVLAGKRAPTDAELSWWSSVLGVDGVWLATGRHGGPPRVTTLRDVMTLVLAAVGDRDELAGRSRIPVERLNAFEAGVARPTVDEAAQLGLALGIDPSSFLAGDTTQKPIVRIDEPENLLRYLRSNAGTDLEDDWRLRGVRDALLLSTLYVGDMPTAEDWHAVRRALEQGQWAQERRGMSSDPMRGVAEALARRNLERAEADAKRQAARDASPEGTTDVLVIDDDWVELSEATQKAAKESKG